MTNTDLARTESNAHATGERYRRHRQIKGNLKLHAQIRDLVQAYTRAVYIGENRLVEDLALRAGFAPHDLCICDIRLAQRPVTLIVVPHQGWRRREAMPALIDLRHRARMAGYHAILIPQSAVEKQPRLGNASLLGAVFMGVTVDATSRMVVLEHLIANGDCPLGELASLITHRDPFGAILHLAAVGALKIDLRRVISPHTMVGLPDPRFPSN